MTGLCHETTEAVTLAAVWIAGHRHELARPIIPAIKALWPLTTKEACEALAEANRIGGAHGGS